MKFLKVSVLAISALIAFACAAAADKIDNCEVTGQKGSITIDKPIKAGQLTLEVSLPAPIWYNGDTAETIKDGLEYCLAAEIAWRAGLNKIQLVPMEWDAMIAGQAKDFDLALSQVSITEERKKVQDFSTPYFNSDIGVLARLDAPIDEKSIKQAKVGVQQATTAATFVSDKLGLTSVQTYPDAGSMFAALGAGQIDAAITDTTIVLARAAEDKGKYVVVGQYQTGEVYGALYPKGNPNNATIDKIIASIIADGTLDKLRVKYLVGAWGKDPASVPYFKP